MATNNYQYNLKKLFEAEQEANKIISQAQEKYDEFLEDALKKADMEISVFKEKLEKDFQSKKVDFTEEDKKLKEKVDKEKRINLENFNKNKKQATDLLLERCLNVKIELSKNISSNFK